MDDQKLEKEFAVHVYDTGPDGRLSLYSLFDYLQDIASDHAVMLGYGRDDLLQRNQFWVLSRMYAEISKLPEWGEKLTVRTWPRGIDRLFALRDYQVTLYDGTPVAMATSSWLIIDRKTRKIQRPDNGLIISGSGHEHNNVLPRNAMKLDQMDQGELVVSHFRVKVSDLDVNLHTNNVRYLQWIIDTCDPAFIMNNAPVYAEINYIAESHFNDEIIIRMSENKNSSAIYDYSVVRIPDNSDLCRVRINWKNNLKTN